MPEIVQTKRCPQCKQDDLPLDAFARRAKAKDGRQPYCRNCNTLYVRGWIALNRDKTAVHKLWATYRLRPDDIARMLEAQHGCCALCLEPFDDDRPWQPDHDHHCCPGQTSCGSCIRGLLHGYCNRVVGSIEHGWGPTEFIKLLEKYLAPVAQSGRAADF
jgi:hypothetical protein